jgi:hypothetical protein
VLERYERRAAEERRREDAGQTTAAREIRLPEKRMDRGAARRIVQSLLIEDLVAERIADLHRQGDRDRLAVGRGSGTWQVAARLQRVLGYWLVGMGLRLALAADSRAGLAEEWADIGSSSALLGNRSHGRCGRGRR